MASTCVSAAWALGGSSAASGVISDAADMRGAADDENESQRRAAESLLLLLRSLSDRNGHVDAPTHIEIFIYVKWESLRTVPSVMV